MRFSQRTNWNTEESALARAHRLRAQAGLPAADLTASNPTRCGFVYPADLLESLTHPEALDYDPQPRGSLHAREAVCAYYADRGTAVRPEQVVLTTSTSEAYSYVFRLLCDPGGEILAIQPGYPLFDFLAALDDVRLKAAALVYDHGWQIDPEGLQQAITAETRAIMLVHPNNPTGHFTKPWEAEELAQLCREFDLSLIVDEVFLDYGITDQGSRSLLESSGSVSGHDRVPSGRRAVNAAKSTRASQAAEKLTPTFIPEGVVSGHDFSRAASAAKSTRALAPEGDTSCPESLFQPAPSFAAGLDGVPVFVVSGLSKIAGLPQMKAAWIVATGPEALPALDRLEVIADTFLSMNAPVQCALPKWLAGRASIQAQIRHRLAANLAELDRQLVKLPEVRRLDLEGGWYATLRVPALRPDEQTVLALLERGVWVHPGYFFGMPESGWLVVSLLGPEAEFSTGVTSMVNYMQTNQDGNKTES